MVAFRELAGIDATLIGMQAIAEFGTMNGSLKKSSRPKVMRFIDPFRPDDRDPHDAVWDDDRS